MHLCSHPALVHTGLDNIATMKTKFHPLIGAMDSKTTSSSMNAVNLKLASNVPMMTGHNNSVKKKNDIGNKKNITYKMKSTMQTTKKKLLTLTKRIKRNETSAISCTKWMSETVKQEKCDKRKKLKMNNATRCDAWPMPLAWVISTKSIA